jgi:hypothetical protein
MDEEVSKASLLRAWKDQDRFGIKFLCSQHGSHRIKIGVDVGSDHFHKTKLSIGNGQLAIFNEQFKIRRYLSSLLGIDN